MVVVGLVVVVVVGVVVVVVVVVDVVVVGGGWDGVVELVAVVGRRAPIVGRWAWLTDIRNGSSLSNDWLSSSGDWVSPSGEKTK